MPETCCAERTVVLLLLPTRGDYALIFFTPRVSVLM